MRFRTVILSVSLALLCAMVTAQGQPATSIRLLTWQAAGATVSSHGHALDVFSATDHQYRSRMLWETPSGRCYIFDQTIDATNGTIVVVVSDDASGWFAELKSDYGLKRATVQEFSAAINDRAPAAGGVNVSLRTSEGTWFSSHQTDDAGDGLQPVREFAAKLARSATAEALRAEIGPLAEDLQFFAGAFADRNGLPPIGFALLVETLGSVLNEMPASPVVQVAEGKPSRGPSISTSEQLTFAARFRSLPNPVRPLESR